LAISREKNEKKNNITHRKIKKNIITINLSLLLKIPSLYKTCKKKEKKTMHFLTIQKNKKKLIIIMLIQLEFYFQ
jgi:hypothetical protein